MLTNVPAENVALSAGESEVFLKIPFVVLPGYASSDRYTTSLSGFVIQSEIILGTICFHIL